jgi:antitoxin component of RelBE/YafQ-DinJ toxin-antitoxin module
MKTAMSVKIDKDVRNRARSVAKSIGIPLSMVVNQQLKQFADERRIEFYEPLVPNAKTRNVLDEALRDIREGNGGAFSPMFDNADDAIKWLERNDA